MDKLKNLNFVAGVLFLLTAALNFLNIDYSDYSWIDFISAILALLAGVLFIQEAFKNRKDQPTLNLKSE